MMHKQQSNSHTPHKDSNPNPKLARYLHRIEQLVGNRNSGRSRSKSPIIASRINKPIKANYLDSYLKYELTLKIIYGVFDKNNQLLIRYFFNQIKRNTLDFNMNSGRDSNKIEKIYKFVPIQKTQCAHMVVDTGISTRILVNAIKGKLKNILKYSFDQICAYRLACSEIVINTGRSTQSNITPISLNKKNSRFQYSKYKLLSVIQKMVLVRKIKILYSLKDEHHMKQINNKSQIQETFAKNQRKLTNEIAIKMLFSILTKIKNRLLDNSFKSIYSENQQILENQYKMQVQTNKIKMIANFYYLLNLKNIKNQIKYFSQALKSLQNNQQKISNIYNKLSENYKIHYNKTISRYAFITKLFMQLQSMVSKKTRVFYKKMQQFQMKRKCCHKIQISLWRSIKVNLSLFFILCKQKQHKPKKIINFQAIGVLMNISYYFRTYLQQPFNLIHRYSENYLIDKKSFYSQNSSMLRQMLPKQKAVLPKILLKAFLLRYVQFYIKIRNNNQKAKNNDRKKTAHKNNDWSQDVRDFILQRQKFNNSMKNNYKKFQSMLQSSSTSDNGAQYSTPKQKNGILSPKNKNRFDNIFPN